MRKAIKTAPNHTFHGTGQADKRQRLFSVTPGIPLADALNSASDLLSIIREPIYAAAMGEEPLQDDAAWLVHHTLESAKAVIDSLWDAAADHAARTSQE